MDLSFFYGIKKRFLGHNYVYTSQYYAADVEGPAVRSAPLMAAVIMEYLSPSSVLDVGCGTGALLFEFRRLGCRVQGIEYSDAAISYCRHRNLDVVKAELEKGCLRLSSKFDVAVSFEVAEHLAETSAERYVDLLASAADVVVMTAAHPGQGGVDHVNEQPAEYWVAKFQRRGFVHRLDLPEQWRKKWDSSGEVAGWYSCNLLVFAVGDSGAPQG